MCKNKKIIMIIVALCVLVISIGVNADDFNNSTVNIQDTKVIKKMGKDIKAEKNNNTSNEIVLEIDDRKISKRDLNIAKISLNTDDNKKVEKVITKRMATQKIAKDLGITATDDEVKEFIDKNKEAVNNNEEAKAQFESYIEGLGMTESEFWNDKDIIRSYKETLITGKLKGQIRKELKEQNPSKSHNEIEKLMIDKLDNMIKKEKSNMKIKRNY
ncbi:SurA N-terminal domain-containing protein [Tepidibacter aestuarii]|uniref:SurA N-terminal domain-containing protein n=1 Tax=Tepidibacter aestuarii TaxID=2925782 RepID=UPI0020BFACC4|nr:SurA N-terminal domain-containing protein [Tepidibacter aestuarii]CAH2213184.1 conserved exported protein of unknown function [Tepidibacter aestuarii]